MGNVLVLIALVLEIVHFAVAKDTSLPFIALVLVTLALLVPFATPYLNRHR